MAKYTKGRPRSVESAEAVDVYASITVDVTLDPPYSRAIAIATGGTLKVQMLDGNDRILPAMPDGYTWPIQVKKIYTGADTTATGITVLY